VYGASPLDSPDGRPAPQQQQQLQQPPQQQQQHRPGDASPSAPGGDALAKFGSRVSSGFSSLLAEAGQVLKTVVASSPQHIPVGHGAPPTPDIFGGGSSASGGHTLRKPSTVLHTAGAGLAGRMGARLDDVLRTLEVEVACLVDGQVGAWVPWRDARVCVSVLPLVWWCVVPRPVPGNPRLRLWQLAPSTCRVSVLHPHRPLVV
jgi:hypothetical protein